MKPRPRVIPVLLLRDFGLVKSVQFRKHKYIGDPINAVKIFNSLRADELVFLDIDATRENRLISLNFVQNVMEEANMPFSVGGGIRSLQDIHAVINSGAERVVIGSYAARNPDIIKQASETFGSTTITVCMDVRKTIFKGSRVWTHNGRMPTQFEPVAFAKLMQDLGAGELIVQSIDRDGTMSGYDIGLVRSVASSVQIPVTALGGAGSIPDLRQGWISAHANGLGAGSLFVYQSKKRGVLINYPDRNELAFEQSSRN